jgi:primosomal protein N' (replication factor Y)
VRRTRAVAFRTHQRSARETWRAVAEATARVVVGARSALFLPFANLGLDRGRRGARAGSFKQEDGTIYQRARHGGGARALEGCPIVLASATPSLETLVNVKTRPLRAPCSCRRRHGGASLPRCRGHRPAPRSAAAPVASSPAGARRMTETLAAGEQSMLFLNRRGYAPLTLCRACGTGCNVRTARPGWSSTGCTGRLQCHHCGYAERTGASARPARARDSFVACGPGVERVAEEARNFSRSAPRTS